MKFKKEYGIIYCKDEHCSEFDNGMFSNYNTYEYYKGYLVHRENGPAIEWDNGDKSWYFEGKKFSEKNYYKIINLKNKNRVLDEV